MARTGHVSRRPRGEADHPADAGLVLLFAPHVDQDAFRREIEVGQVEGHQAAAAQGGGEAQEQHGAIEGGPGIAAAPLPADRAELVHAERRHLAGLFAAQPLRSGQEPGDFGGAGRGQVAGQVLAADGAHVPGDGVEAVALVQQVGHVEADGIGGCRQGDPLAAGAPGGEAAPVAGIAVEGEGRADGGGQTEALHGKVYVNGYVHGRTRSPRRVADAAFSSVSSGSAGFQTGWGGGSGRFAEQLRAGRHGIIVIMDFDSTRRFSSRVEDYIRYRPSYPADTVRLLERECGLRAGSRVADIGSGTGLLAQLFLHLGCEVFGVEPNSEMRRAGERLLANEPRFHSLDGRAEASGLPDGSVDFVTAGQSFHWFDLAAARAEFVRILRPAGWVVLVWNERLVVGRFLEQYEALLDRYAPDYARVDHRRLDSTVMDEFFGSGRWRLAAFPNEQRFDLEGVLGRLHSSSYAPPAGSPDYPSINEGIARAFTECQQDGQVAFLYETKVYYGRLE